MSGNTAHRATTTPFFGGNLRHTMGTFSQLTHHNKCSLSPRREEGGTAKLVYGNANAPALTKDGTCLGESQNVGRYCQCPWRSLKKGPVFAIF